MNLRARDCSRLGSWSAVEPRWKRPARRFPQGPDDTSAGTGMWAKRPQGSAPAPPSREPRYCQEGWRGAGAWRSPGKPQPPSGENSQPRPLSGSASRPPAQSYFSAADQGWDRATVLPSRRGLLPGLRSGPQLDSRLLFLFAQRNPLPQGSSQRRCAAKERPWILTMQGSKWSCGWGWRCGRAV